MKKNWIKVVGVLLVVAMVVGICTAFVGCGKKEVFTGYDIELARKAVQWLNSRYNSEIELEFIEIEWGQKETLLENGSIDLVWNGMTINEERIDNMSMSIPYLANKQSILYLKSEASKYDFSSLEAFKVSAADAIVYVEDGSAAEDVMKQPDGSRTFGKEVVAVGAQFDILTSMTSGSADIGVLDSIMAGYYLKNSKYSSKIGVLDFYLSEEEYGIGAKKGNDALICKINEALIGLVKQGTIQNLGKQFGLASENLVAPTTTNPKAGATDDSWDKVVASKKLIIGYTVFAPIAFTETK